MDAFLTDFGLAKSVATGHALSLSKGSKLTRTGQALGTPAYMSPEQARGESAGIGPLTDVWSLGCVLYEALSSRRPFDGETPAAAIANVLLHTPARLRSVRPEA